jgi:hypothetical protein
VRGSLSAQTTRSVLCLGSWSDHGLIKDDDVKAVVTLPEVEGEGSDYEMEAGWDIILDDDM